MALATSCAFHCCTTADILTKHLQQCFLFFIVGNSQVSVYRTIGPTLVFLSIDIVRSHRVIEKITMGET